MDKKRMFIIDAMALAFRAYFARLGSGGRATSSMDALDSSIKMTLGLLKKYEPDYIVLASDCPEPTFRHRLYPEYKANRGNFPERLAPQIPYFFKFFDLFGVATLKMPGYEADDIIASLAARYAADDMEIFILSGDKDLTQLIGPHVSMVSPQGGGDYKIYDEAEVVKRYGCRPEQMGDFLALKGDSSDNIPGVFGVGDKKARELLEEYGSLAAIYSHLDAISSKRLRSLLIEHKDAAFLSRQLVELKRDLPTELDLATMRYHEHTFFADEMLALFTKLGLDDLVGRIQKKKKPFKLESPGTVEDLVACYVSDPLPRNYHLVNTTQAFAEFLGAIKDKVLFAFDSETTGLDIISDQPIGISFSWAKGEGYYIPLLTQHLEAPLDPSAILAELKGIFSDPKRTKLAHNLKFDMHMLENIGIKVAPPFGDTMIAAFIIDPGASVSLDSTSRRFLKVSKVPTEALIGKKAQTPMKDVAVDLLSYYACEDADCCFRLEQVLSKSLRDNANLNSLYHDLDLQLVPILAQMERAGIFVDVSELESLSTALSEQIRAIEHEVHTLAGTEFKLSSPQQLREIIFTKLKVHEELGIKGIKKVKSGFSTDASVLERLSAHPLVAKLLEYRSLSKIKNTYADSLPKMIHSVTGRIHTHFHQTGTATGRLSSSQPNLQNIPIRTPVGRKIRHAFTGQDDKVLVSADYSQIELRLLAHMSGDHNLKQAFKSNADVHVATAAKVFNLHPSKVGKEQRAQAKAINYGIAYGMGPRRFADSTGLSLAEARDFIARYFNLFPKLRDYMEDSVATAEAKGWTETLLGRRRPLAVLNSTSGLGLGRTRNVAINTPVQGTAADLMKLAMLRVHKSLSEKVASAKILLQIHDELLVECDPNDAQAVRHILKEEMEQAMEISVPLVVDVGVGKTWLEAH